MPAIPNVVVCYGSRKSIYLKVRDGGDNISIAPTKVNAWNL